MRFITTGLLLSALLLTGAAASAQTAEEIIDKSLAASGGREALAKITSRSATGTMSVSTPGGDVSGTVEILNQAPNKMRRLIVLDLSQFGMPAATIDVRFDGTAGYSLDSMRGDSALTGAQLDSLKHSLFPSSFLGYKEDGTRITYSGKQKVGDRDAYALVVTPASGPASRVLIDAESYLPVQAVTTVEVPEVGNVEQTATFSDYRDVDGVKVAFKLQGSSSVQSFTIALSKVEHNVKVDPALFSKPVAK